MRNNLTKKRPSRPTPATVFNFSLASELTERTRKFKADKAFSSEQEVFRVALADFLKRQGY